MLMKKPWAEGKLLWTGAGLTAFLVAHTRALRFGPAPSVAAPGGGSMRDMWALQLRVFRDPVTVAWHLAAAYALAVHFDLGWPKTARKVAKDDPAPPPAAELTFAGRSVAGPAVLSFAAAPLYFYLVQHPLTARFLQLIPPLLCV